MITAAIRTLMTKARIAALWREKLNLQLTTLSYFLGKQYKNSELLRQVLVALLDISPHYRFYRRTVLGHFGSTVEPPAHKANR